MITVNTNGIRGADFEVNLCDGPNAKGVSQDQQHFRGSVRNTKTNEIHQYVVTFLQVATIASYQKSKERHVFLGDILGELSKLLEVSDSSLTPLSPTVAWPEDNLWAAMMLWESTHRNILFNRSTLRYWSPHQSIELCWPGDASYARRFSDVQKQILADLEAIPENCVWIELNEYSFDGMPKSEAEGPSYIYKPQETK